MEQEISFDKQTQLYSETYTETPEERLFEILSVGDVIQLEALLLDEKKQPISLANQRLDGGDFPLHRLAMRGDAVQMIQFLINVCGVDVDAIDLKGRTPLHNAVRW
jgi:ankyrin repeat protein